MGKEYVKAVLSPCLLNFSAEYIMQNARLVESKAGVKTAGRNTNLRYAGDNSNGRKQRGTKEHLDEGERGEGKKTGLKLNIQKTKIVVYGPITSCK